jgi:hypothetical protein
MIIINFLLLIILIINVSITGIYVSKTKFIPFNPNLYFVKKAIGSKMKMKTTKNVLSPIDR